MRGYKRIWLQALDFNFQERLARKNIFQITTVSNCSPKNSPMNDHKCTSDNYNDLKYFGNAYKKKTRDGSRWGRSGPIMIHYIYNNGYVPTTAELSDMGLEVFFRIALEEVRFDYLERYIIKPMIAYSFKTNFLVEGFKYSTNNIF